MVAKWSGRTCIEAHNLRNDIAGRVISRGDGHLKRAAISIANNSGTQKEFDGERRIFDETPR